MSGRYEVQTAAVDNGSNAFVSQHGVLDHAIAAFQTAALNLDGAFGFLGPSMDVLNQYVSMTEKAFRGLDTIAQRVADASQALSLTAKRYRQADQASTFTGSHG